ncbi:H-NS family nucleoid-associated regulatory protein [Xenophilus sp. Marseille-Q4582]|uniref:H-NS histone family protein n=1 Tax=Xenophilus sp. Marseille-Q4582 TaxID=2866600 RepID=UPI001CE3E17B|nr:H-NS histone family protein [Xenophilus sp. Marseille-Q4582]
MALPDISRLSYTELQQLIEHATQALNTKKAEELKVLADQYALKLKAAGFTLDEGIKAVKPYAKKNRAPRGSVPPPAPRPVKEGVTYRNPQNGETWTAGTRGRIVGWLQERLNAGSPAEEFEAN